MSPVTIGRATLYLGDCRDVLPTLPQFHAVITDPPYGLGRRLQGGTYGSDTAWDEAPSPELLRLVVDSASNAIIWGGNYFSLPPSRGWLAWLKRDAPPSRANVELAWTSMDINARAFDYPAGAFNSERVKHPTQKPLALMKWCLDFVPEALTVLDPFMGSGTTGVACSNRGLKFVGIEKEPRYFKLACDRLEMAQRQGDFFVEAAA